MAKKSNSEPADPILAELTAIKRLLMCALLRSGASQGDIGKALGVTQATVSRMLSNNAGGKPAPSRTRSK